MSEENISVYRLGAEDGLYMGPVLAVAMIALGASTYLPVMALVALAACIAVPVVAYLRLGRTYLRQPSAASFSALWLEGICMFFFGALIMALLVYGALRVCAPTFMADQVDLLVGLYSQAHDPAATQLIHVLTTARDNHALPTPIEVALELIYGAVFSGSLLSMFYALIIRHRGRNRRFHVS